MGVYEKHILPRLVDWSCGAKPVRIQRGKIVPLAQGRVLEIGIGTGLNLPFYDPDKVERVIGLDPGEGMLAKAGARIGALPFPVQFVALEGENIPLDRDTIDTIVVTYTLCTIPDVMSALAGMRRVVRPAGQLLFCEHGKAPDKSVRRWQDGLNPLWKRISGGCNLNRDIPALLRASGFNITALDTMYLPGTPRFAGFNYWGAAQKD